MKDGVAVLRQSAVRRGHIVVSLLLAAGRLALPQVTQQTDAEEEELQILKQKINH